MILKAVHIRFYKSFNFDYLRKYHPKAESLPWETMDDGRWFPFVRVQIDPEITSVVGANESGKSHLLDAIESGIKGGDIERETICRYSDFFTVKKDQMNWPDFGFEWTNLSESEADRISDVCKQDKLDKLDRPLTDFFLLRHKRDQLRIYLQNDGRYSPIDVPENRVSEIECLLPKVFRIDSQLALPETVSLQWLISRSRNEPAAAPRLSRTQRLEFTKKLLQNSTLFTSTETIQKRAQAIHNLLDPYLTERELDEDKENQLAYDLLIHIAKVDVEALQELQLALERGREGYVNAIVQEINSILAETLNFPKWWAQDRNFQLLVSPRESDLVLTVRDRTGEDYSFAERSNGLKYFLSYYIQYLAYEQTSKGAEILLMDEPDAFLSSQGQQDLLKIFAAFARPANDREAVQVIYVTHSPFLIDKNRSERVRVLEKGVGDEGTRVVRNAGRNHYEPLRSAFGAMLGERVFIGNCNLIVEGQADQVLLAGASSVLRQEAAPEMDNLDLNHVTIVPAGSASHVPYLVYLARGRDVDKPAIVVLLDSDKPGHDARADLREWGIRKRPLIKDSLILQIDEISNDVSTDLPTGSMPVEIEDLIPIHLAHLAGEKYLREVIRANDEVIAKYQDKNLDNSLNKTKNIFNAVAKIIEDLGDGYNITKLGASPSLCVG